MKIVTVNMRVYKSTTTEKKKNQYRKLNFLKEIVKKFPFLSTLLEGGKNKQTFSEMERKKFPVKNGPYDKN